MTTSEKGAWDKPLKALYETMETERAAYLKRARACSVITIPSLIPPEGHSGTTELPTPYSSHGARCVNNLSAKLMLTMFPPNQPFFKLSIEEHIREELGARLGETEKATSKIEQIVLDNFETTRTRSPMFLGTKYLVVGGNCLIYDIPDKDGGLMVYPLSKYVVQRRPNGKPKRVIVMEMIHASDVPESIQEVVLKGAATSGGLNGGSSDGQGPSKEIPLYTGIEWDLKGAARVHQEIGDTRVPDSEGSYPAGKVPWNPVRMVEIEGEDYGRSYVEEYFGDLQALGALSKAIILGTAALAKIIWLIKSGGRVTAKDLQDAESGDVLMPDNIENEVGTLSADKGADFSVAERLITDLKKGLAMVFLLNSGVQRPGERVTAEEIHYMAEELESQMGGIYSGLAHSLQRPLVATRMHRLTRQGKLPALPPNVLVPKITTGVDALGRGNDFTKLKQLTTALAEVLGPEFVLKRVSGEELGNRFAAALGVNPDRLILTDDEVKAEAEQEQQQAMQQAAVAPSINQAGRMMSEQAA